MAPRRDGPLPVEALRDVIGVCRCLFLAWKRSGKGPIELEELAGIGRELSQALKLAKTTAPDSLGHRAAWSRAEAAMQRLGELIGEQQSLRPALAAGAARVVGAPEPRQQREPSQREAKKHYHRMRS